MVANTAPTAPEAARYTAARFESLDGIRLVAALGVVLFHYNGHFELGLEPLVPGLHRAYLLVDLFFALSGFVIAENYAGRIGTPEAYGTYMVRRLARIYPLHLLTLVAVLAIGQSLLLAGQWPALPPHMQPDGIWSNLALVQAWGIEPKIFYNYPSWSISAEIMQYALFPLYLLLALRLPAWAAAALFAGATLAIAGLYLGWQPWSGFTMDGALRAAPTFFAGVALSVALRRARSLPRVPWAAVYLYGVGLLACIGLGLPDAFVVVLAPGLILLAVLAERGLARTWLRSRPVAMLGRASYSLYMIHIPVSMVVLGIGRPLFGGGLPASVALFLTALAMTLGLSLACFRWFEVPAQRFVNRSYDALRRPAPVPVLPA